MRFDVGSGHSTYSLTLVGVAPDDLMFADEEVAHVPLKGRERRAPLGGGHRESRLSEAIKGGDKTAQTVKWSVDLWRSASWL